jgi:hypothetical protein
MPRYLGMDAYLRSSLYSLLLISSLFSLLFLNPSLERGAEINRRRNVHAGPGLGADCGAAAS